MKHPVTLELHAYWNEIRQGRAAPERGDIDPAAIRSILADTFMLDVETRPTQAHPDYVFRLSGTRLNAMFLRELKGLPFLDLWSVLDRAALRDVVTSVLDDRTAMVAGVRASPKNRTSVDLELLLLPLRHHGKTHARMLGSLAPAWTASWLGLLPVEPLTLTSFRHVVESLPACAIPAAVRPPGPGPVRRGRFVVLDGGRQA